jgi:nitrite reductase/ring-hydroxylating ferredoxin subunit
MAPDSASLARVAVYRRAVHASLERVWENVLDWEHLPWLHRSSFSAIDAEDWGDWGWRARVATQPAERAASFLLELRIERDARRYVAHTLEGVGEGTEIWTQLDVRGPHCTGVEVAFHVPGVAPESAAALGGVYVALYTTLWDEDEAMMVERTRRLAEAPPPRSEEALALGRLDALRPRLPLRVALGGREFRVVEVEGRLLAHAVVCPHRLGPLASAPVEGGCITCPWHGYRFDLRTGRSADGGGLRLPPAPRVRVDARTSEVWLAWS